jgi:uncharacterized membrane protein YraQ (UPF0718 family)
MSYDDPALAFIMKGPIVNKIAMMKIRFFMSATPFFAFFYVTGISGNWHRPSFLLLIC